jgi:ABC-type polysaccharide/polyol phosphate transport system ATPase subunit
MSSDTVIKVDHVSKAYTIWSSPSARLHGPILGQIGQFPLLPLGTRKLCQRLSHESFKNFFALKDVSLEIRRGESFGIIGKNGSGKSTLLQIIAGILTPTSGSVTVDGKVAALLELGSGFNPDFTGRENVYVNASILGLTKAEIDERIDDIAEFADIGEFMDQPVKLYSSGMFVRLAFAVQVCVRPSVLIIDEALAVGDAAFQRKCFRRLDELHELGLTILFVSHDLNAVTNLCTTALLLEQGRCIESGSPARVCDLYQKLLFGENTAGAPVIYGDGHAAFTNIWFENGRGESISSVSSGAEFSYCYTIRFGCGVADPVFGLRIKTIQGVVLSSTNTFMMGKTTGRYEAGDTITVRWKLCLPLSPGHYFFSCGCSYPDADRFLCRQVDTVKLLVTGSFHDVGLTDAVRDVAIAR